MCEQNTTIFEDPEGDFQFNFEAFRRCFYEYRKSKKLKATDLEEKLASQAGVSKSAVHAWKSKSNGPSELSMIQAIAQIFQLDNWKILTRKIKGNDTMELKECQVQSLKRFYDSVIEFLDEFEQTDGFTGSLWVKYRDRGIENPLDEITEYADKKHCEVAKVLQKEYFYLHDTPLYDQLLDYTWTKLIDTYDGKLKYGYRFGATVDGNPTTNDDYETALNALNEIIETYV